jgi:hypothetical protein
LQLNSAQPGDVAESRNVELHHVTQEGRILDESVDVVVRRGSVRGRAFIPVEPIDVCRIHDLIVA